MSLSRRETLKFLLGTPLAAQACRRPARAVPGEFRGASLSVGHKLRDVTPAETNVEHAGADTEVLDIAIIGAGPSGLSAAWWLERQGEVNYQLFDLEKEPGGTSSFGTDGVVAYPWGAHYVPLPTADNPPLVQLLDEMGVLEEREANGIWRAKEQYLIREPEERLFIDGRWHAGLFPSAGASSEDLRQLQEFERLIAHWVAWRDSAGRRAFRIPVAACSTDAKVTELDKISAEQWLQEHGLTSPRLRWYVEYATRDDYGLSLGEASAWAMLFYFTARVPAVGKPSAAFVAWPEGNGRLVQHLSSVAAERIRTRQLVTDVIARKDRVDFAALDANSGQLRRYRARQVILAVPKFVVPRLLRELRESPDANLEAFSYGVWLVANLHLKHRPRSNGFPLCWDNVIYESPSLGYVCATHQALRDRGPTIWTYYLPLVDADPKVARHKLFNLEHAHVCESILADLGQAHPDLGDALDRIDVWRWGHAMIRPAVGFITSRARQRAAAARGRVFFAHSDLSGMALFEEAQFQGIRAAEEVLAFRRRFDLPG